MTAWGAKALGFFGWFVLVAGLAASVALGLGAYRLAGYSWDRVVAYRSPYIEAELPAAEAGAAGPAGRMVVVVVDGLREDVSRQLPGLEQLRAHGSDYVLTLGQPSLSYPGWTTLLSGAPQAVSGVTTNWFEGRVPVETLLDTGLASRTGVVVVGSPDLKTLYAAERADGTSFRKWEGEYLSGTLVDDTLRLVRQHEPRFVFVLLPDVDEAGHDFGGTSPEYLQTARRVDVDITRLVEALEDTRTAFAVVSDHGHIDTGGHGGWEPEVVRVPAVFAGPGVGLGEGEGRHEDFAPTIAALAGIPSPRHAKGEAIAAVLASAGPDVLRPTWDQRFAFAGAYAFISRGKAPMPPQAPLAPGTHGTTLDRMMADAEARRLAYDRSERAPLAAGAAAAILLLLVLPVVLGSWRAFVASLGGTVVYGAVYGGLYFGVHGYRWSLSSFNSEDLVEMFFYGRMAEAALSLLVAAGVAALVYGFLREHPMGPVGGYLPWWLALGPAVTLLVLACLGLQAAWFYWRWGIDPVWSMPDLRLGFKYDLDLIQATAVGFAGLLTPVATYVVGKYHPRVHRGGPPEGSTASVSPFEPEAPSADPTPGES